MQQQKNTSDITLQRRRQLLKLGAAGMPMLLTLRASAREAVVSQLRCVITMPGSVKILVDDTGAAWVGDASLKTDKNGGYKKKSVKSFKNKADYIFPEGSVPQSYRPANCDTSDGCSSGDDGGYGDDGGDDMLAYLDNSDDLQAVNDHLVGGSYGDDSGGYGDDSSDDCGDDSGGGDDSSYGDDGGSGGDDGGYGDDDGGSGGSGDCYKVYSYSKNQEITPGNYVNGGALNYSGDDGLYLALSVIYAEEYGDNGSWPGVSCLVSVLNYIGQ